MITLRPEKQTKRRKRQILTPYYGDQRLCCRVNKTILNHSSYANLVFCPYSPCPSYLSSWPSLPCTSSSTLPSPCRLEVKSGRKEDITVRSSFKKLQENKTPPDLSPPTLSLGCSSSCPSSLSSGSSSQWHSLLSLVIVVPPGVKSGGK